MMTRHRHGITIRLSERVKSEDDRHRLRSNIAVMQAIQTSPEAHELHGAESFDDLVRETLDLADKHDLPELTNTPLARIILED